MKKLLCLAICLTFLLPLLSACSKKSVTLGLGVVVSTSSSKAEISVTAAAVTFKANGRIGKCEIDTLSTSASMKNGVFTIPTSFKTKGELGDDYNMVTYGNSRAEWYEQRDAFCEFVVGKTVDQVRTAIDTTGKGTDPALTSTCTINVSDFLSALVRAEKNAKECNAKSGDELRLAFYTTDNGSSLGENGGKYGINCNVGAFTVNDGKVTAAAIDTADVSVSLKADGTPTASQAQQLTKRQKGDSYGMYGSAWGSTLAEWYTQVDAFEAFICGKTEAEILGLEGEGGKTNNEDLKASCTIAISDFCKLVDKIFTP